MASWRVGGAHQVLIDDAVAGGKERQHVRDEVPLLVLQRLPVQQVLGQIHLNTHTHTQTISNPPSISWTLRLLM